MERAYQPGKKFGNAILKVVHLQRNKWHKGKK
jgi:hypothetical protein